MTYDHQKIIGFILDTEQFIIRTVGPCTVCPTETVQQLWSGYGEIVRYKVKGPSCPSSIIAKSIRPPKHDEHDHPRGWNTSASHKRKLTSYLVESNWYQYWAQSCGSSTIVPHCFGIIAGDDAHNIKYISLQKSQEGSIKEQEELRSYNAVAYQESFDSHRDRTILLSDLDIEGFPVRHQHLSLVQAKVCIQWLAHFHATFMQVSPDDSWPQGLWQKGCYWQLETRDEEYQKMAEGELKKSAYQLDKLLNSTKFMTIIHGDAKVANFCFNRESTKVAAVDFQYAGGGCGMRDLVYLIGSCLTEKECRSAHQSLCSYYFSELKVALLIQQSRINADEVEKEWSALFAVAWADFHRFILGWSPQHKKNNDFSRWITEQALDTFS